MLNNIEFLHIVAEERKYTFISTGMSTLEEIDRVIEVFKQYHCPFEIMHCVSTYPMEYEDANLKMILTLKNRYNCPVGYSDHSKGRLASTSAVAVGASSIEKHVTIDKTSYGSDQSASLEMSDLAKLITDIEMIELMLGNGEKVLCEKELAIRKKLRGV